MFNAPDIIMMIPDIKAIYDINDSQCTDLENAVDTLDKNIFLEQMDAETVERWENMLQITVLDNDTIEDRRFRVKAKVLEKLPYSFRVIMNRLDTLCPEGYGVTISADRTYMRIKLALRSRRMVMDVTTLLEDILPLNIAYDVIVMFNQYSLIEKFTYAQLAEKMHRQIREEDS